MPVMKKFLPALMLLAATLGIAACSDNKDYDEVPEPIIMFLTKYWPNPIIENYSHPNSNTYEVDIKNGPSFVFNGDYDWTEADGEGLPLPEVFLYDQLPSTLYNYLEGGEYLNQVFEIERNARTYELSLLNINLTYDISTDSIREN